MVSDAGSGQPLCRPYALLGASPWVHSRFDERDLPPNGLAEGRAFSSASRSSQRLGKFCQVRSISRNCPKHFVEDIRNSTCRLFY